MFSWKLSDVTIRVVQIATTKDRLPDLDAVNTGARPDTITKLSLKTDIALYNRNKDKATPERTDCTQMELWMEFKTNSKGTAFREFLEVARLCVRPRVSSYQHYRSLNSIVGRALTTFGCTKQLVAVVLDAVRGTFTVTASNHTLTYEQKAHWHAFRCAHVLHRDISVGNIIVTEEGKGLLIDWEMAKMMDDVGSRRPDRTVRHSLQRCSATHREKHC